MIKEAKICPASREIEPCELVYKCPKCDGVTAWENGRRDWHDIVQKIRREAYERAAIVASKCECDHIDDICGGCCGSSIAEEILKLKANEKGE